MTEDFFQFIWQYQLFQGQDLKSTQGALITVIERGKRNTNAGPDFEAAKIKIGDTLWAGAIELHLKSSDWFKHKHQNQNSYDRIILHVVYENDLIEDIPQAVATLELKNVIQNHIIQNYTKLYQQLDAIPCKNLIHQVNALTKEAWLSRLLVERWQIKTENWLHLLEQTKGDWSVLLYWLLAQNFGFKINQIPFLQLAQSLPLNIIAKHRTDLFQLEALLFGQAGLLKENFKEEYPFRLQKEYQYLATKYRLKPLTIPLWKFMRLRPQNFPTIRIAQFAALIHVSVHLFSQIIEDKEVKSLSTLLNCSASEYWDHHYRFDEYHDKPSEKNLGKESIENIIINTVAPLRYLYQLHCATTPQYDKAILLLENIKAERNAITRHYDKLNWQAQNAAQSQAQIQLYQYYCSLKKCLECSIGHSIIRLGP